MKHGPGSIEPYTRFADSYDKKVREYGCFAAEILFGMSYEYVAPGSRMLDIGIGTGLSSAPFAKAGLEIFGIDGSEEMLRACKTKKIAKELAQRDLNDLPLPYAPSFFDCVVCCGVFHFFGDLEPVFAEIARILRPGGVFSFTVMVKFPGSEADVSDTAENYRPENSAEGVVIFTHERRYIEGLLHSNGFDGLKEQLVLVKDGSLFLALVAMYKA